MKKEITAGLEDYIEAISNKIKESGKVRPIDLSKELNVSRASVSEALKRLSELIDLFILHLSVKYQRVFK